jgi:hypothetical protein
MRLTLALDMNRLLETFNIAASSGQVVGDA